MAQDDLREQARRELARRELARRESQAPAQPVQEVVNRAVGSFKPRVPIGGAFSRPRFGTLEQQIGGAEAALSVASGAIANVGGALAGFPVIGENPDAAARIMDKVAAAGTYQPRTEAGQEAVSFLGSALEPVDTAITDAFGNIPGGPVAQTIARTAVEGPLELLGAKGLVNMARAKPRIRISAPDGSDASRIANSIPDTNELFNRSTASFTKARQLGSDLSPASPQRLASRIDNLKDPSGLPTRVNPVMHPSSTEAIRYLRGVLDQDTVSFDDLLEARDIAKGASMAPDARDARIGRMVTNEIDDYIDSLSTNDLIGGDPKGAAAALKEGRELWRRARNAQKIEELIELAHNDTSMYSGSGFENALTKRFRQLSARIIKGQEKSFTAAEAAEIKKIGSGGDVITRALRFGGKLAPTGVVSGGIGAGAGFAIGGPAGAVALPAAGGLSRIAATRRGVNSVNRLDEALRGGLLSRSPEIR